VILADVDAAGRLTDLLGASGKYGVADLIARSADGDVDIDEFVVALDELPPVDGFRFLPAGTPAGEGSGTTAIPQMGKLVVPRDTKVEDLRRTTELIDLAKTAPAGYIFDRSRAPGRWRQWQRRHPIGAGRHSRS
jgi:hypothetical protein